ncbi:MULTISPECIES: hypothetical protein [unclassified Variovorax]|uniref:hypothetical protein n=1 Tax=unclassified Variovorax TaxID=663243 RepID=UPI002577C2CE|nr:MULTISPECIES: hypothetical protein [unclassified Variovorax]MDM0090482.1 hypothetical protein [Variovorax sp. J22G40]MDM0147853.1 hypothetical protein [Variovorax sp. J2P1-31]
MSDSFRAIAIGDRVPVTSRRCHAMGDGLQRLGGTAAHSAYSRRPRRLAAALSLALLITLAGCGAPAPKDYGGSWAPVNRFQSTSTEIPLSPAYTFYASPMDATLRTMLARWATDNGLQLSYRIASDFTLHQPVAKVRTHDIQSAVNQLSAIYVPQGLSITADSRQILVQGASAAAPVASGPY